MKTISRLLMLILVCFAVGCKTGADNDEKMVVNYDPVAELRTGLEGLQKSGRIGSNIGALNSAIRDLKAKDASKGEVLEKEMKALLELQDPAKIKAKAGEMLGKL